MTADLMANLSERLLVAFFAAAGLQADVGPMTVTAYTNYGTDNITASLQRTRHGVAACTEDYAFGQMFYVKGYGWVACWDRGRLREHGVDLDVWFPSRQEALRWGRRELDVWRIQ